MKAVVVARYGGLARLALIDRPTPELRPRDVRIVVKAAGLNPLDLKIREGKLKLALKLKLPIALGCDAAGVIHEIGPEVTKFALGDEVYTRLEKGRMGGFAEQVCADEAVVAKKPAKITFAEAASIPLAALTALQALREVAALSAGQRVLIHAGAGGVGSLAIQIAKILGLHVATTTSAKNADFVRGLGADTVIDYTKNEPLPTELDGVFDTLGTTERASIAATRRGGVVVGVSGLPDLAWAREWLPAIIRPALWDVNSRTMQSRSSIAIVTALLASSAVVGANAVMR